MRILFLTFYFEPDLSAGSFRNTALLNELLTQVPPGTSIDVITSMPSRYSSFTVDVQCQEKRGCANIHRIELPAHHNSFLGLIKSFVCFTYEALKLVRGKKYDLIYASSSRLMTATLGSYFSRKFKAPLYLDIRDIFLDTITDMLPRMISRFIELIFTHIEQWTFSSAQRINLVSKGFERYFRERHPSVDLSFFSNGIDNDFLDLTPDDKISVNPVTEILYAGNIGDGQGLHLIIPELAERFSGKLNFRIIGDGGQKKRLAKEISTRALKNVQLLPPLKRSDLIELYQTADVLFVHLNDYKAFRKVLPSKLFEYAALGKPIWAGASGYASEFIQNQIVNSAVFDPCDVLQAEQCFKTLDLNYTDRLEFKEKFSRKAIIKDMAKDVLLTVNHAAGSAL